MQIFFQLDCLQLEGLLKGFQQYGIICKEQSFMLPTWHSSKLD